MASSKAEIVFFFFKQFLKIFIKKITQDTCRIFYTRGEESTAQRLTGGSIKRGLKLLEESPTGQSGNKFSIKMSDSNGLIKH